MSDNGNSSDGDHGDTGGGDDTTTQHEVTDLDASLKEDVEGQKNNEDKLASTELSFGLEDSNQSPETMHLEIMPVDAKDETDALPVYNLDEPPSYKVGSFRKSIRYDKEHSTGKVDFSRRVFTGICCGIICSILSICVNLAIAVAMVAIGAVYLKDCPRQRYIPIYLVVGGAFGLARALVLVVDLVRKRRREAKGKKPREENWRAKQKPNPADGVITCFLMAWFIAGCVWIYGTYGDFQSEDPTLVESYCNETLYLFAFWVTTASFILLGLGLLCCCIMCIGMCVIGAAAS